jgi:DNA replication and repair protein RecF
VIGANGAGKTNLLEALHVGTQGFSPRTRREARVVRFGADGAHVAAGGTLATGRRFEAEVSLDARGRKRISLDGAQLSGADELRRRFPVLVFTPDRLAVVKGGPVVRRAYLDRTLGRPMPARALLPPTYARALAQRNAALRRVAEGVSSREALGPWDETLARTGSELDAARGEAVAALAEPFERAAEALGLLGAKLRYAACELTAADLERRLAQDLERRTTGEGPHLRDLEIAAGERELRMFGSQGEQRIAVLALVLAEARLIGGQLGEPPLLLLDDVLSELDDRRREALVREVPDSCQTVLTATTLRSLPSAVRPALVVDVVPGEAIAR